MTEEPEGYVGPAALLVEDRESAVHAVLAARFEPLVGRVAWFGRVEGAPADLSAGTPVRVRTPLGEASATVTEQDLWGHWHVRSTTRPPFPVEILDVTEV